MNANLIFSILKDFSQAAEYCIEITENFWLDLTDEDNDIQFKVDIIQSLLKEDFDKVLYFFNSSFNIDLDSLKI